MMPSSTSSCSNTGHCAQEAAVLLWRAEPHHPLDPGPVVPGPVHQHDFARQPAGARRSAGSTTGSARRSVGAGSATIRATRGFRNSVTRLIVLPLPAASRPSKTTSTRAPDVRTHSCMCHELRLQALPAPSRRCGAGSCPAQPTRRPDFCLLAIAPPTGAANGAVIELDRPTLRRRFDCPPDQREPSEVRRWANGGHTPASPTVDGAWTRTTRTPSTLIRRPWCGWRSGCCPVWRACLFGQTVAVGPVVRAC